MDPATRTDSPSTSRDERRVILLGSTGSIGTQTLDVISHLNLLHARGEFPTRFRVVGLAAGRQADLLASQARHFDVRNLAIADQAAWTNSSRNVHPACSVRVGTLAPEQLVREVECDIVLAAMVGAAGLPATLAALQLGRDVALANKETLVAAGELVVPAALHSHAKLLPVDSEHAGVWQALQTSLNPSRGLLCPPLRCDSTVARIVLTASGGPFRNLSKQHVYNATPAQALDHPTWKMGPKVTIDSASLTNKALEIIEAHWLFGLPPDKILAVIHPQSIVHALVEFTDGSVVAQLASPDMRLPIQAALAFPHQAPGISRKLDLFTLGTLDFSPPDLDRFPALGLAYDVIHRGGTSGAVFNAANEAAVELFLAGKIPFGHIPELTARALNHIGSSALRSLSDVFEADAEARLAVKSMSAEVLS